MFLNSSPTIDIWIALFSLFVQIILLILIVLYLIKKSSPERELAEIMPILEYLENQQMNEFVNNERIPQSSDTYETNKNELQSENQFLSLMQKEWLLFKRTKELKNAIIILPIYVLFFLFLNFLPLLGVKFSSFDTLLNGVSIFLINYHSMDVLSAFYYSHSFNKLILPVTDKINQKVKIFGTLIIIVPLYGLLCLVNVYFGIITGLAIILFSNLVTRLNIQNPLVKMFFASLVTSFTPGILF